MSRSAPPIIRLARFGRGRAKGAGEGDFLRAIQDSAFCFSCVILEPPRRRIPDPSWPRSKSIVILILKNLLFTLLVPGTVGVYLPLILSSSRSAASGFLFGLAILLFAIGGSIYGWCVFDFASFGRGTPLPLDAPRKLVRRGLYRYSRNPMYVGVLTVIFGWAALYKNPWLLVYGAAIALSFYSFVVFFEEPILSKRFGSDYEQYRAEVARWLSR